jgi:hypothetical protein
VPDLFDARNTNKFNNENSSLRLRSDACHKLADNRAIEQPRLANSMKLA